MVVTAEGCVDPASSAAEALTWSRQIASPHLHKLPSSHHPLGLFPPPVSERMLGLNPQFQGSHPFHSMFTGLHAANMNPAAVAAAAAAAAAAASTSASSLGVGGTPPISTPSSLPSPGGNGLGRSGGRDAGSACPPPPPPPPHPMNVPLNMLPLIWHQLNNLLPQLSIAKMDPLSQVFCLKWNNHQNNLLTVLDHLYQTEAFCDVTLACDNTSIKCHKMILSACSSYFQTLFMENTCEHPIVFLKDIKISEVRAILDYMYKGEVNVAQEELPGLLKVAELLRVKGLVEGESEKLLNSHIGKNGRPLVSTSINDPPTSSSKLNGGDVRDRSEDRRSTSDSKDSPNGAPAGMRPFMPGMPQLPMPFGLPGMFPNLLGARDGHRREDRDDKDREGSPSPGSGNKRRKVASGSGGSCSSKESGTLGHQDVQPPNMAAMDLGRPKERTDDEHDFDKEAMLSMSGGLGKPDLANYVPNQRLEWKRYKQYTRNDIMSAIEEVKNGMSALQASRKYGVPSRTLYDKVKKMGITTGRQVQRKSLPNYPSQFPGLMMNNMNDDLDDTNDSSGGAPGDAMDGRATMVPPSGLNYMLDFMKMRAEHHGKTEAGEVSLTPMNLTTMLSGNSAKRSSEQSLSPHSPVSRSGQHHSSSRDLDDEQVDSSNDRTRDRRSSGDRELDRESHQPSMKDLQSQFFADLKRLGSNIPTQSNSQNDSQATPSSTTHSPPAPGTPSKMEEENLPPRKRKVSQEHQKSPFNGLHEVAANERGPGHPTGAENDNSVDCRN